MTLTRARLLHPHTGDPIAPLGFRRDGRPIFPILGAGPEDDIDDEIDDEHSEDDDGEDDDGEDDDEDEEGGKPAVKEDGKPLTQKDYDALQLALRNSRRAERRARRSERDGGRGRDDRKPKDDKPKGKEGEDEDAPDVERIRLEAEDSAAGTWKPLLVRREAKDMLKEAGLIGDPGRLLKLIDMEDVEVDPETGEIDGLDEQIDDLRKEYKHLFRRRGTRRINGADKDGRETRGGRKLTATEIQAMQLLGDR